MTERPDFAGMLRDLHAVGYSWAQLGELAGMTGFAVAKIAAGRTRKVEYCFAVLLLELHAERVQKVAGTSGLQVSGDASSDLPHSRTPLVEG